MIRWSRLVPALAVAALLAACAGEADTPLAPSDAPAWRGSQGSGNGNGVGGSTDGTGGTANTTSDGDGDPVPSDSVGRGGHIVGGN